VVVGSYSSAPQPVDLPVVRIWVVLLMLATAPVWVRMTGWMLRHRHPDSRWLSTQGELYEADHTVRYYRTPGQNITTEVTGPAAQRPDPKAQVDEIRAQLYDRQGR